MHSETPFEQLSPDALLDAIESLGLRTDGRLHALNSFENRVYQVGMEDGDTLIAKFYRPGRWSDAAIIEEHDFTRALQDAELPVAAPLAFNTQTLHEHGNYRFALYPRIRGRAPELCDARSQAWMGRFIARIHLIGEQARFKQRDVLDACTQGRTAVEWFSTNEQIPAELQNAWQGTARTALDIAVTQIESLGKLQRLRIHGDCHAGNVLWNDDGPWFVDFDDACNGLAIQDLWLLLSGDRDAMQQQLGIILPAYRQFRDFDLRELALIEAFRTLRLLHHAAWIGRRWSDPAFPRAFSWFGTARYWQDRILELKEQIAAMQEPPLEPAEA